MPELALYAGFLAVAFGRRRGWRGISGRPGSAAWRGGVLFAVALAGGLAATLLGPQWTPQPAGLAVFAAGAAGCLLAQRAMGRWWRVGVDPGEPTALVTDGVFAHVRNPFFTALTITATGLVLLVANAAALASLAALVLAIGLQVRVVEEPHLRRLHGDRYARYAARTGRFLPRLR